MTAQDRPQAIATLKAITYRLSSTSTKQLPQVAPQIAGLLWNCRQLLSLPAESSKQAGNDASVLVHRFRTHISTLLNDRTVEGRWSAVVLVKATIEAGGLEVLSKSNAWVRSLLGILKKADPPTTRCLVVITLTRIFMLTWPHSNLIREITTPALPTFVATCVSSALTQRCSNSELLVILEAFAVLIPRHPTIFRANESQIRTLLLDIVSSESSVVESHVHFTNAHIDLSRRLLVLLHHCSPKQGAADKWDDLFQTTIAATHATCDHLFRSVVESWHSASGQRVSADHQSLLAGDVELEHDEHLRLAGWKGVYAGSERVCTLLLQLQTQSVEPTAGAVTLRLGLLADVLTRLFSITVPSGSELFQPNHQISKEERETLFVVLPKIHCHAIRLIACLVNRFGGLTSSFAQPVVLQILSIFECESFDVDLRIATYGLLKAFLALQGPSLIKQDFADLEPILKICVQDLMAGSVATNSVASTGSEVPSVGQPGSKDLRTAAESLLPVALSRLSPNHVSPKMRRDMERAAVLTENKDALVASVLNPWKNAGGQIGTSLLPLLARQHAESAEVEALLRPRMPFIRTKRGESGDDAEGEELADQNDAEPSLNGELADASVPGAEIDDEPAAGLLEALSNCNSSVDEDLYSASPPRDAPAVDGTPSLVEQRLKRTAAEANESETSAKRVRGETVAKAVLPDATDIARSPDFLAAAKPDVPATVLLEQPQSGFASPSEPTQQAVVLPAAPAGAAASGNVRIDSDDSDFEIPPLTMEPDTEPEDEDEDQDGEDDA